MLISAVLTSKTKILKSHRGFSLMEIMVAMTLVAIVLMSIPFGTQDGSHEKLEDALEHIDRAQRFASNESILRNQIIRIVFNIDDRPNTYVVEAGPSSDFPLPEEKDVQRLSSKEKEAEEKKQKKFHGQFQAIEEFKEQNKELPDLLHITGMGRAGQEKIITNGPFYVYFYPTGEKDDVIIFVTDDTELAYISIPSLEQETQTDYYRLSDNELANLEDSLENKMKEFFSQWQKQ